MDRLNYCIDIVHRTKRDTKVAIRFSFATEKLLLAFYGDALRIARVYYRGDENAEAMGGGGSGHVSIRAYRHYHGGVSEIEQTSEYDVSQGSLRPQS